jgi:hypothetical protein
MSLVTGFGQKIKRIHKILERENNGQFGFALTCQKMSYING